MALAHLPGCNMRHTRRQRCSSWQSPRVVVPAPPPDIVRATDRLQSIPFVDCAATITGVGVLLLFLGFALVTNSVALDRLGWIDIGLPNYIREAKPSRAHLIATHYCCGAANGKHGVTQLFYGSDVAFDEVTAHYTQDMAKRGYSSGVDDGPNFLSREQEIWFDRPGGIGGRAFAICFSITPFTDNYDLRAGLPLRDDDDAQSLRHELAKYAQPYVAQYSDDCGG